MNDKIDIPKWFWACVLGVSVAVACVQNADAATKRAPIVSEPDGSVMLQTGWHYYEEMKDGVVLFCIEQKNKLLTCAVYANPAPGVAGIVFIGNVLPAETTS